MRYPYRLGAALAVGVTFALAATAQSKALMVVPARPGQTALLADVIVIGKVAEIEKETVEASAYPGAPKDQKQTYKIAVVKIDEAITGGKGLTQFRVGFPEGAGVTTPAPATRAGGAGVAIRPALRPGRAPVTLAAGQEGCFFLVRHHDGDFYILAGNAAPLEKKDENYEKLLAEVKKTAKILDDPVAALKAKELNDRFQAAHTLLQHYQINRSGKPVERQAIPAEENKLILAIMLELPWQASNAAPRPVTESLPPIRNTLWAMTQSEMVGFKPPTFNGQAAVSPDDRKKAWEDATTAYLKDNADKIKLKGYVK
jgi:hypothetical protein